MITIITNIFYGYIAFTDNTTDGTIDSTIGNMCATFAAGWVDLIIHHVD
jgi:hypothetical protein